MCLAPRTVLVAALVLSAAPFGRAQTAPDPSGHWEGSIQAPGGAVAIEVDLAKNAQGVLDGTIGVPAQHEHGIPFSNITADGNSIEFQARSDQSFKGTLSSDGRSMSGRLIAAAGSVPIVLTRTGDARIEPPAKSAAVGKDLEGSWSGTLDVDGGLRLVLTVANHADGTATAAIVNVDQGGVKVPVSAITQTGTAVTLDVKAIEGSYTGVLNKDATELTGTFRQGPATLPLTFRRAQ